MAEGKTLSITEQVKENKLLEGLSDEDQGEIMRQLYIVMNQKTTTYKVKEDGKDKTKTRKLVIHEALSYVLTCRELGLNPLLDHVQVLEGKNYIGLEGRLQNAQKQGVKKISVKPTLEDPKARIWRHEATVIRSDGGEFSAVGSASMETIARYKATNLFLEQMSEGRAIRRALRLAYPVGMPDAEEQWQHESQEIEEEKITQSLPSKAFGRIPEKIVIDEFSHEEDEEEVANSTDSLPDISY